MNKEKKIKVAVYISCLNSIGGVETFAINLCNRAGFDLIFDAAKIEGLGKLKNNFYQLRHVKKEYDVLIIATAWGTPPKKIKAKRYVQMIHADYSAYIESWNFKYKKYPFTTHHVCVGENVRNNFEKVTGEKCDKIIYNLLSPENDTHTEKTTLKIPTQKKQPIKLITLSRFSKEKGFERMIRLAEKMKNEDYVWNIYGDTSTKYAKVVIPQLEQYKQVKICGITTTPKKELLKHDYLVQLSDTEGFPYSVYESLQMKIPVISTNYPAIYELLEDGKNGYIFDMNLSDFDINKIKNIPLIKSFTEKSTEKDWFEFLNKIL